MTEPWHAANGRFARGYNCAQSVLSAFSERYGISCEDALRVASPFGAGMGRRGEICGVLSGALMVLGLEYGGERPEAKEEVYRLTREFLDQFEKRYGSVHCRDLLGCDISTAEGLQAARDNNVFAAVCPALVDETTRALARHLEERPAT